MRTDKKKEQVELDRRRLLKGAGFALGAAAATTAVATDAAVAGSDDKRPQQAGYRETKDVKTYYRLARF